MILRKFVSNIMGRGVKQNEVESDTESTEDDTTETNGTASTDKKSEIFGIKFCKFSYKLLPKGLIKFSFLALNGLTLVAGITAVISSAWLLTDRKLMSGFTGHGTFITILLLIGLVISFVSFLGILGFTKRRRKFLVIYIICHSLSLCIIFVCAVMSFTLFSKIVKRVKEDMTISMDRYWTLEWAAESWDNTHSFLKCCGIKSSKDWLERRINIPQSCCFTSIEKCHSMSEALAHKSGCYKSVILLLKSYINAISISALLTSLTLLTSVFFAVGVVKRFKIRRWRTD